MDNQQAIDEALDKLEIANEEVVDVVDEVVDDVIEGVSEEVIEEAEQISEVKAKDKPPGYIDNIEDWKAAGKDPLLFKSPELYSAEYERIQENKDLKETMVTLTEGLNDWKAQQRITIANQLEQDRINATAELEQAREDDDVDAAIKAQKKIGELNKPKQQEAPKTHPVVSDFYSKNPILDKNSTQYDEEVFHDASMYQASILDELTGGNRQAQLTPSQIERSLKVALNKAKALSPDKFVSPRNARRTAPVTPKTKVTQKAGDYATKLKSVKSNSMNKHDTSSASDMYDYLKDKAEAIKDPALKAKAHKAAENYAKTVLGE